MTTIRVLIVDDHIIFHEGLKEILEKVPDLDVVGSAGTGAEAVSQAETLVPDVILMDINMPDMNGIEATQKILKNHPDIRIIMLTMLEDDDSLFAAMRAGARGYILKGADKTAVINTIRSAADGEALFGPAIASRLTKFFQNIEGVTNQGVVPFPELTDRERELLELVASGKSNQEISHQLHITNKTVSNHVSSIFNKLKVGDRAQAIVKARQAGLGGHNKQKF